MKGDLLKKELAIFTFKDLIEFYPFRHLDKTRIDPIDSIGPDPEYVQLAGKLTRKLVIGEKAARRLLAYLQDDTGEIELTWFQGIKWIEKFLELGQQYLVFGKPGFFMGKVQMAHPEIEPFSPGEGGSKKFLEPIYSSTEKLKARGMSGRAIGKLTQALLRLLSEKDFPENLPASITSQYRFISRWEAIYSIHFPGSEELHKHAVRRLKFEELFFAQLRLGLLRSARHRYSHGWVFDKVGDHFHSFYNTYLPFQLTNAQKRVLKEMRRDLG